MLSIVGALACICCIGAIPITFAIYLFLTGVALPPEEVTQTGEPYYMELSCGDSEHFTYVSPRLEAATSDAVIVDDIEERKARIKAKPAPKVVRSLKDRRTPEKDPSLEILG